MIVDFMSGKLIVLIYIFACVYTDLKKKEISLGICILMYTCELIFYAVLILLNEKVDYKNAIYGFVSGCVLFAASKLGKEFIGEGDALFFMATGLALGIKNNILVMLITFLFIGIFALFLYVISFIKGDYIKRQTLPLLPFTLPVIFYVYVLQSIKV